MKRGKDVYYSAKKEPRARPTHDELSADVAKFLASGRKIKQLPGVNVQRPRKAQASVRPGGRVF